MATIASLNVALTASSAAFTAGLAKARSNVTAFKSSLGGLNGVLAGLGTAAATAALTAWVKSSAEAIDAAGKFAASLGIATEHFAGLQYAADLSGVSTEQLQTSLRTMVRNVADAATGSGSAAAALTRLGLSAQSLSAMSPDRQLAVIADAMKNLTNPTERVGVAMDVFGRAGVGMIPMLRDGAAGLQAMQVEAEKMGLAFSAVEFTQIERANDALTKVHKVVQGIGQSVAIELAPFIEAASNRLVDFATSGDGAGRKVTSAMEWVATTSAKVADVFSLLASGWHLMRYIATEAARRLSAAIDVVGQGLVELVNMLPGVQMEWTSFFKQMEEGLAKDVEPMLGQAKAAFDDFMRGAASDRVVNQLAEIRREAEKNAAAAQSLTPPVSPIEAVEKSGRQKTGWMKDSMKEFDDAMKTMKQQGQQVFEATRTPMEKYESSITQLGEMLKAGVIDWDTYGRAVRDARGELEAAASTRSGTFQVMSRHASVDAAANPARNGIDAHAGKAIAGTNNRIQEKQLDKLGLIHTAIRGLSLGGGLA